MARTKIIRPTDDELSLLNLLQTAIETLLGSCPVLWTSHRIRIERANCCDDLALAVTNDRLSCAQSLTWLDELRQQAAGPLAIATALLFLRPGVLWQAQVSANAAVAPGDNDVPSSPLGDRTVLHDVPLAEPKPAGKPIDLGRDHVKVEVSSADRVPGGLYGVGSHRIAGQVPDAKTLYA